jgi:hypothetical protein
MNLKHSDEDEDAIFDSRGCLKDKRTFRVPLEMRDERSVFTDTAAMHRPGFRRMPVPAADSREAGAAIAHAHNRAQSYFASELSDARAKIGDHCVVDGKHGMLIDAGNGEIAFRAQTLEEARADREKAYDEYDAAQQSDPTAMHPEYVGFGSNGQGANWMKQPSQKMVCTKCDGIGADNIGTTCTRCKGSGYVAGNKAA